MSQHRLIKAFLRQPVDKTPVWLMRQAGRYLPEYRAIREKNDFVTLCKTPELACEITLQPLKRFALDGAIIFSDILTIPDAMGLGLYFAPDEGPRFHKPILNPKDIEKLSIPDPETELRYVMDAIRMVKMSLKDSLPLLGFSGSPWTLATYMAPDARKMVYQAPRELEKLLDKLAQSIILYLNAQIAAGANAVMIFDTWGGDLTPENYKRFSLMYIKKIIAKLHRHQDDKIIPIILFTKQGGQWLKEMLTTHCDVIGIDWTTSISKARREVGHAVAIQGNLNPQVLYASPDIIEQEVKKILDNFGPYWGHVFNLGHGVPKDVNPDNIAVVVETVHRLSQKHD